MTLRERIAARDPKDVLARARVAFIHPQLGSVTRDQGNRKRALEEDRRAVEMSRDGTLAFVEGKARAAFSSLEAGRLEASAGRMREACDAFGQAFQLYQTVPLVERMDTADFGDRDPLPDAAREAARCGVDAARQWLRFQPRSEFAAGGAAACSRTLMRPFTTVNREARAA